MGLKKVKDIADTIRHVSLTIDKGKYTFNDWMQKYVDAIANYDTKDKDLVNKLNSYKIKSTIIVPEDPEFTYAFINSIHDVRLNRKTNNINILYQYPTTDIIY